MDEADKQRSEEFNRELTAAYDKVSRAAIEEHVLALIRGWAPIRDDGMARRGMVQGTVFRGAELVGEPGNRAVRIKMHDVVRQKDLQNTFSIWESMAEEGKLPDPGYIAGEFLTWARGG